MTKETPFEETMLDQIGGFKKEDRFTDTKPFNECRHPARRFILDPETVDFISETMYLCGSNIIHDNWEFALPPFENTYIEMRCGPKSKVARVGFLMNPTRTWFIYDNRGSPDGTLWPHEGILGLGYYCVLRDQPGLSIYQCVIDPRWDVHTIPDQEYAALIQSIGMLTTFLLLLHKPAAMTISPHPYRATLRKGKRVVYATHHTVEINLRDPRQARKLIRSGARSTPRRHEVRGHFVHYHQIHGCTHDWVKLEPKETDAKEIRRWGCSKCETLRVWRPSFGRGDATKGFATHNYHVTAKAD